MKSNRLSLDRMRRTWRLLGVARELRQSPDEQARQLVDGLCKLFGGDNGFFINISDYRPGGRLEARSLIYGSVTDPLLEDWFLGRLGFERTLNDDIMVVHSIGRMNRTTVLTQSSLWPTLDPRDYPLYAEIKEAYSLHDNLVLMFRPGRTSDMWCYAVHRRSQPKPYTPNDTMLAKVLIGEMRKMYDAGRLTINTTPALGLPRRPAQVLERLLRGQSPKQIAPELGMSVHTVRDHVKGLLERFELSTTQELLAHFLNDPDADRLREAIADRAGRSFSSKGLPLVG